MLYRKFQVDLEEEEEPQEDEDETPPALYSAELNKQNMSTDADKLSTNRTVPEFENEWVFLEILLHILSWH